MSRAGFFRESGFFVSRRDAETQRKHRNSNIPEKYSTTFMKLFFNVFSASLRDTIYVMNDDLVILLGSDDADLRDQILAVAPAATLVGVDEIARAQVIYEGVKPDQIGAATALRWLQLSSAGVDRWPLSELNARGVRVTNASGIHAQPIVEQMFGMLLMHTRALDVALREQPKREWRSFDYGARVQRIAGKTLGVLGVGAIGAHAAQVGAAFGMRVIGLRRSGENAPFVETMFTPDQRHEFFARSDVVMNTLPLTDATRGFMGEAEFAALPDGAIFINTGRGKTVDTAALIHWLHGERAGAALLDVTDPEPLPSDHPLWNINNVLITPHYSGSHPDYDARANAIFIDNLRRYIENKPLHNLIGAEENYSRD